MSNRAELIRYHAEPSVVLGELPRNRSDRRPAGAERALHTARTAVRPSRSPAVPQPLPHRLVAQSYLLGDLAKRAAGPGRRREHGIRRPPALRRLGGDGANPDRYGPRHEEIEGSKVRVRIP